METALLDSLDAKRKTQTSISAEGCSSHLKAEGAFLAAENDLQTKAVHHAHPSALPRASEVQCGLHSKSQIPVNETPCELSSATDLVLSSIQDLFDEEVNHLLDFY